MFYSKIFKKFKNINHCFFSKKGGFSKGIYKSLNCGKGSKDNKKNVFRNLNLVSKPRKTARGRACHNAPAWLGSEGVKRTLVRQPPCGAKAYLSR